jgi:hypothetical protein
LMIIIIVITMLNNIGRRNYCWSAGILSMCWSSGIRQSCCSDVVLIISFTVDLQFVWSTSSTHNIDVIRLFWQIRVPILQEGRVWGWSFDPHFVTRALCSHHAWNSCHSLWLLGQKDVYCQS